MTTESFSKTESGPLVKLQTNLEKKCLKTNRQVLGINAMFVYGMYEIMALVKHKLTRPLLTGTPRFF